MTTTLRGPVGVSFAMTSVTAMRSVLCTVGFRPHRDILDRDPRAQNSDRRAGDKSRADHHNARIPVSSWDVGWLHPMNPGRSPAEQPSTAG